MNRCEIAPHILKSNRKLRVASIFWNECGTDLEKYAQDVFHERVTTPCSLVSTCHCFHRLMTTLAGQACCAMEALCWNIINAEGTANVKMFCDLNIVPLLYFVLVLSQISKIAGFIYTVLTISAWGTRVANSLRLIKYVVIGWVIIRKFRSYSIHRWEWVITPLDISEISSEQFGGKGKKFPSCCLPTTEHFLRPWSC